MTKPIQHISEIVAVDRLARLVKEVAKMRRLQSDYYIHRVEGAKQPMRKAQARIDALVKLEMGLLNSKQPELL